MLIDFITTESLSNFSGGWSGNSYNIYNSFKNCEATELSYIGPIKPPVSRIAKLISKILRLVGLKSNFYYFSNARLSRVKKEIELQRHTSSAAYTIFMGSTHWIKYHPSTPYGAYIDASFKTYFENNIKTNDFSIKDIARIEVLEKHWLENATHVFWASDWAKEEAIRQYGLSSNNHFVVGIGGNLPAPRKTDYKGGLNFLLIAQNFMLKGGNIAFDAFIKVYAKYPSAKFFILGQKPPSYVLNHPGVQYSGYLHKNIPEENKKFLKLLSEAFCLIHPTKSDTIAQVIIECGYFGCPTIAPNRFAIPELIVHEETGILLEEQFTTENIIDAMLGLIEDKEKYQKMRKKVREYHISNFTYKAVTDNILGKMNSLPGFKRIF